MVGVMDADMIESVQQRMLCLIRSPRPQTKTESLKNEEAAGREAETSNSFHFTYVFTNNILIGSNTLILILVPVIKVCLAWYVVLWYGMVLYQVVCIPGVLVF